MIGSLFRWVLRWTVRSAVVVGAAALVARLIRRDEPAPDTDRAASSAGPASTQDSASTGSLERSKPELATPHAEAVVPDPPATEASVTADSTWVAPTDAACPTSHPVKAKESSGIFHVPGGLAYDRTVPDRCYRDVAAAEADGYRQSKR